MDRLADRVPVIRKAAVLWRVAEIFDTLRGSWGMVPGPMRGIVRWGLAFVLFWILGLVLAWLLIAGGFMADNPTFVVVVSLATGFGLSGIVFGWRNRGAALVTREVREVAEEPEQERETDLDSEPATDAPEQQPKKPTGLVERFGVLWKLNTIHKEYALPAMRLAAASMGMSPQSGINVEHVPYCPNEYDRLVHSASDGVKPLMDNDDVSGWSGRAHCATCDEDFSLAPDYRQEVPLKDFWQQVNAEYGRD